MKKLLLTTSILLATFATPALAEGCSKMIATFDSTVSNSNASDEVKMKALELRDQGAKQHAADDEKACQESLAAALQKLNS